MLNFPYSELTGRRLISKKFIKIDRTAAIKLPSNMEGWLDTNSLARFVVEVVEQLDTSEIEAAYKGGGSAPYAPKMMLALLFPGGRSTGTPITGMVVRLAITPARWAAPPAAATIMSLLYAWRFNPEVFADGFMEIPESGNGVPDILDEVRWELEWMMKMQRTDGAVHHKATLTYYPECMPEDVEDPLERLGQRGQLAAAGERLEHLLELRDDEDHDEEEDRGGDEEGLRQIERHTQVTVEEAVVLLGVQDLEHESARWHRLTELLEATNPLVLEKAGDQEYDEDDAEKQAHRNAVQTPDEPVAAEATVGEGRQRHRIHAARHGDRQWGDGRLRGTQQA